MDLKGSKTEANLLAAFAGESQARTRYTFFASVARREGFELKGGDVEIAAKYPAGVIGTTTQNLRGSAEGEKLEWGTLYPSFEETARKEGFIEVAGLFHRVASVEEKHEARYLRLLKNVESGQVFKRPKPVKWKCRNCGHVLEAAEAPMKCPVCVHDRAYFELFVENY